MRLRVGAQHPRHADLRLAAGHAAPSLTEEVSLAHHSMPPPLRACVTDLHLSGAAAA